MAACGVTRPPCTGVLSAGWLNDGEREERMSRYHWMLLSLLVGFWGLVGINRLGITYLFPILVPAFHLALWQTGLLISGTSFTWAFSSWISGWLSDHYGRRRVMLPGAAFACVTTAAMGATWNFLSLFIVRDLIGIGDGVGWPNGQAVIAEEFPRERRALVQGAFTAGYPLFGSVLGALIVTGLAVHLGWRWVFPILGGVFFLVVIGLWVVMREPGAGTRSRRRLELDWRSAFAAVRDRRVIVLMLIQSGALGWLQVGVGYNTLFLTRVRHVSLSEAGAILAISGVVGVVGTLLLPALSDYAGRKPVMVAGGVLSGVLLTLYALGHLSLPLAVAVLAANAFFVAVLVPLGSATIVSEIVGADVAATAMGAINFVGVIIGTFLLPLAGGVVAGAFGLPSALMIAAVCAAVAGLLVLGLPETAPRVLLRRGTETPVVA